MAATSRRSSSLFLCGAAGLFVARVRLGFLRRATRGFVTPVGRLLLGGTAGVFVSPRSLFLILGRGAAILIGAGVLLLGVTRPVGGLGLLDTLAVGGVLRAGAIVCIDIARTVDRRGRLGGPAIVRGERFALLGRAATGDLFGVARFDPAGAILFRAAAGVGDAVVAIVFATVPLSPAGGILTLAPLEHVPIALTLLPAKIVGADHDDALPARVDFTLHGLRLRVALTEGVSLLLLGGGDGVIGGGPLASGGLERFPQPSDALPGVALGGEDWILAERGGAIRHRPTRLLRRRRVTLTFFHGLGENGQLVGHFPHVLTRRELLVERFHARLRGGACGIGGAGRLDHPWVGLPGLALNGAVSETRVGELGAGGVEIGGGRGSGLQAANVGLGACDGGVEFDRFFGRSERVEARIDLFIPRGHRIARGGVERNERLGRDKAIELRGVQSGSRFRKLFEPLPVDGDAIATRGKIGIEPSELGVRRGKIALDGGAAVGEIGGVGEGAVQRLGGVLLGGVGDAGAVARVVRRLRRLPGRGVPPIQLPAGRIHFALAGKRRRPCGEENGGGENRETSSHLSRDTQHNAAFAGIFDRPATIVRGRRASI